MAEHGQYRDLIQGQIDYFTNNKARMKYDAYRASRLPIGSGTIESACKNVIAGRMKQGGMTWSEAGADGMLQIRSSIASGRHLQDFLATLDRAAGTTIYLLKSLPAGGRKCPFEMREGRPRLHSKPRSLAR